MTIRIVTATASLSVAGNLRGSTDIVRPGSLFESVIPADGRQRSAICYVPSRYDSNTAWPLVLAFHPYLQPNRSWARYVESQAAAERHGYILAMPRGSGGLCFRSFRIDPDSQTRKPDDIAFVTQLVESLACRFRIDRTRIYAIGHSNGAMFSHALAAAMPGYLAGFVAVSGPPAEEMPMNTAPTPVMMVHGGADRITPWAGPSRFTPRFARYIDVESTLSRWRQINGAGEEAALSQYDRPGDSTRIVRFDWPAPPARAETVLLRIENGGHRWPDPRKKLYFPFTGEQSRDIAMFDVAWDFLSRQRRS